MLANYIVSILAFEKTYSIVTTKSKEESFDDCDYESLETPNQTKLINPT